MMLSRKMPRGFCLSNVCAICQGQGFVPVEDVTGPPVARVCSCVLKKELLANCERGMKGLSKQPNVPSSPLLGKEKTNLWITASPEWMLPHLRHVAIRQMPMWSFRVASDADMMTAWLANVALQGSEILDPDAASVSLSKLTLVDLVDPPDLLIMRLGVKVARNQAMPEVFYEALMLRDHLGKATWVWDQPDNRLTEGHMCFMPHAVSHIRSWEKIDGRIEQMNTPSGNQTTKPSKSVNIRDIMMGRTSR